MAGVNYLGKPEGHPILGWLCALFAGAFIAGYCVWLNWMQTERGRDWLLTHPGLVRSLRLFPRLLLRLRDATLRRRR